jgi:uncharacterized membrane protein YgcG
LSARSRSSALLALGALLLLAKVGRAEVIRSFDASVHLADSFRFDVEERIVWDFQGAQKHGIFRTIPVRYVRPYLPDYRIQVHVDAVTDANGLPYAWKARSRGDALELRIGDENVLVSGEREYRIRYSVSRGLLYFDDHDELYWNATGNGWPVAIEAASASVTLPSGTAASVARHACFAGPAGSTLADCSESDDGSALRFSAARALPPGSGLTLVVGLPKGFLPEPSTLRRWLERASDFLSLWLLLPFATFGLMWQRWRALGRDPAAADAIPVRYEPPAGLTPAEVGTVVDESADTLDVTASILDLAVRGLLEIEEIDGSSFLFLSNRDYRLRRKDTSDAGLKEHERLLLHALFASGPSVLLSDLRNKFYQSVPAITQALYRELSGDQAYFPTSPDRVRSNYRLASLAIAALGLVAVWAEQGPLAIACPIAAGAILFAFSGAMPRRTEKGRRACDDILGFREFVARVDQDRLERSGGKTADRFEKVLPYAIVLGVADAWATAFAGIYTTPPDWYRSKRYAGDFRPQDFVSDVGRSLSAMGSTLTSRPSSSGSGSSGFSGGSSGGGFGGGGGGSW